MPDKALLLGLVATFVVWTFSAYRDDD